VTSGCASRSDDQLTLGALADWWLHNVYRTKVSIDTWHKAE
jgi:hypothetical protein